MLHSINLRKGVIFIGTAERRLKLMRLLCQRRHEIIPNLATEFGVSVRTIQRDIEEISDILPVYVKTGRYNGGVYVVEGFHLDKMYMGVDEISLLEKIKEMSVGNRKILLSFKETELLNKIIMNYKKPAV